MKKYCIMPFASVRIEDGKNKNSTLIRPCCLFNPDKKTTYTTLNEYFESDMLQELQQHLLTQDTLPLGCSTCRLVEETGQLSVRQLKNRYFDVDHLAETAIQELDIFPSNLCNLKCIMCSPKFSSAIGAIIVMGKAEQGNTIALILGFLAVVLGTLNVVGGFVVTDRMLEMFKKKK